MKYGFDGVIYATEPTKQLGRQLMEEFCEYIYRTPAVSHDWREESILKSLPDCTLKKLTDYSLWEELYQLKDVNEVTSVVNGVNYGQKIDLFGSVEVTSLSSGYCLGSCNWLIETKYSKFAYISSSSTFTTHPCPMERSPLMSCDVMILSSLTGAPSANPDTMLGELCTRMASTLKNGGNVLIPCYPMGVVYDLLECLYSFLDNSGLSSVPVYIISPVAKASLSLANIYAEWLCEAKQSKVYLPDHPFPHAEVS
jgi:integrator complex subunit 9